MSKTRVLKRILSCALAVTMLGTMGMAAMAEEGALTTQKPMAFEDVHGKDTTEAVQRLYDAGVVFGNSPTTFAPESTLTRAEFVTMLGRTVDTVVDHATDTGFTDVKNDGWSTGYIAWAVENELIQGYGDGKFGPKDTITEEQVNLILGRYNDKFKMHIPMFNAPGKEATRGGIAILLAAGLTYEPTEPVSVTGGDIRGYKSLDGSVDVYKGIPYAANAGGENRWKAPQPVEPWDGVRNCFTWGPSAIQDPQGPFAMWSTEYIIEDTGYSEDCLSLNVWTDGAGTTGKPVIVYIHGGGYTSGGSSCEVYNGEYMASQGVVFVSVNYRVGLLGFMAHPELSEEQDGHSGNYGFLDQIQALKWVRENIGSFGGDPGNVTIMGQSAGSMSVNALLQSPLAAGLFQKAVTESGNTLIMSHDTLEDREAQYAKLFEGKTLEELRAMPVDELTAIDNSGNSCVDGYVLTAQYKDALASGEYNDVPVMTGMTQDDIFGLVFTMFGPPADADAYEASVRASAGEYADEVLALYPADENYMANLAALNAEYMIAGQQLFAAARAEKGESPSYVYHLTRVQPGPESFMYGAFHTSDVPYFLNVFSNYRDGYWADADYTLGNAMSGYLLNFAKSGDPNGEGLTEWSPCTGDGSYLNLDESCEAKTLSPEKMELFTKILTPAPAEE